MKAQDPSRIRKQLEHIAQWRASGLSKAQWAAQHGIEPKHLMGWLTYERRWKARLNGQPIAPRGHSAPFVALPIPPNRAAYSGVTQLPTIRIDAIWLATAPMDMRAGVDSALARVISVFGAAHPHSAYLFANARGNRMKVLVHDGIGIWLAARRLHQGRFAWPQDTPTDRCSLSRAQLDALVLGLPWQRIGDTGIITLV